MATKNPRITITLEPQLHAILRRLSQLTNNSQSALIGDLLGESVPIFERMVEVLSAAEAMRAQGMAATDEMKNALHRAQGRIETQLGLVLDDMDHGNRPILEAAEKVQRRGAGAGKRSAAPAPRSGATPLSNRGVRSPRRTGSTGEKTSVKKGGL